MSVQFDSASISEQGQGFEPIAIVGMACRLPGDSNTPEAYWELLRHGLEAISDPPPDRFPETPWPDDADFPRRGGFLKQVDQFDAEFFKITPREAALTDPQQRLLMEVCWEALERAGINPESLRGGETGVFLGIYTNEYRALQLKLNQAPDFYANIGNAFATAAGRLSYFFDFRGPAVSVDTASSSSLVAFHLACQSLRHRECHLALAAGVNLILLPDSTIAFAKAGMLSPDARCKSFDAAANGYARGEGCAVVALKRLADALSDQDEILAVVRGTAVNQDGASGGLTIPNQQSQQAVIRKALAAAGLEPRDISYVEAHGSGTSVGDPIEGRALRAEYCALGQRDEPLIVGSVKTNIGHLESAAGVAGVMKVALALGHAHIPPHLNFQNLHPSLADWEAHIPVSGQAWEPAGGAPRRAGISSFGFSGTNAHVILEQAPRRPPPVAAEVERPAHLLVLGARNEAALRQLARCYAEYLAENPRISLADLCFTAHSGRAHFERRLAVVAESGETLREELSAFADGEFTARLVSGQASGARPVTAFLFTGQGSQYVGMGRQLYQTSPTFRRVMDRCDAVLRPLLDRPLLEVLYAAEQDRPDAPLHQTLYLQPALYALECALASMWKSWGLEPDYVLGHSIGEYAAAYVAGVFSLEDGLKLVAERGRLMQSTAPGGMRVFFTDEAHVADAVRPYADKLAIAVLNGTQNVVLAGDPSALDAVAAALPETRSTALNVSHAFHSPLMEPILDDFERAAGRCALSPPRIKMISNLSGDLEVNGFSDPAYWRRHIRQTVRFADGLYALQREGVEVFIEIGPQPILCGMGRRALTEEHGWLPSLQPSFEEWPSLLHSLGEAYTRGLSIDWAGFERDYRQARRRTRLPTYPFQRQRYWLELGDVSLSAPSRHLENARPAPSSPPEPTKQSFSFLQELAHIAEPSERRDRVSRFVRDQMRHIMRLPANRALPEDRSFKELGFDSLMSTELIARLDRELKVRVPIERLIRADNICNLTEILLANLSIPDADADMLNEAMTGIAPTDEPAAHGPSDFHDAAAEIPQIHAVVTEQRQRQLKIEGRWVADFASCNYLGLDLHPEVIKAIPKALDKWGVHPSWTRAVASPGIYEELEHGLAELLEAPSVLVFPAVTLLHAGVIPILAGYDGVIFKDISAHRSIYEACQIAQMNGATVIDFKHNDAVDLEEKLAQYPRERTKLIAIDGVYSMSGNYPPLPEFARLAKTHNATVYMDDAHGLGVVGENPSPEMPYGFKGNGIVKHYGLDYAEDRMIYVAGLSKSYSSFGAFITCTDEAMKNKFRAASTFIFSGPSPVASLASAIAGLKLNKTEGEQWRAQVYRLTYKLVTEAKAMGFEVVNKNYFPIVGVVVGNTKQVIEACHILWEYGMLITPAIFPIVPLNRGLLRFSITASNTEAEIDRALDSLRAVRQRLKLAVGKPS